MTQYIDLTLQTLYDILSFEMIDDLKYWLDIAKYDLETAAAMLKAGRYIYVLFMCQQALEKILKAHVTKTTKKYPPKVHNLLYLLENAKLSADVKDREFLEKLNYYYLESRYPDEQKKISREINKELAEKYYAKTREVFQWLEQKLN